MTTYILSYKELSQQQWDAFILASPQASVFALYAYMQIIVPEWEAIVVCDEAEKWLAVMPIAVQKKWGFSLALQPILAQHWGIFLTDKIYKTEYEALSQYRKIVLAVIEKLPICHLFAYQFAPNFPYPIPFRQAGYDLHTRYTYHLSLEKTETTLWANLASPLQRQIKKTQKQNIFLHINQHTEIAELISIFRQNKDTGKDLTGLGQKQFEPTLQKLAKIALFCLEEKKGILLTLTDENGTVLAGGIFVIANKKMCYLAGGVLPQFRAEGLMSRLLWEAILYAKSQNLTIFDFEGSMIAGIETFFRKFGSFPVPYLHISHNKLPLFLQWIFAFKF